MIMKFLSVRQEGLCIKTKLSGAQECLSNNKYRLVYQKLAGNAWLYDQKLYNFII